MISNIALLKLRIICEGLKKAFDEVNKDLKVIKTKRNNYETMDKERSSKYYQ